MKKNDLLFLDPKGQKEKVNSEYFNYAIQEHNVKCEDYIVGYDKNRLSPMEKSDVHSNSIYGVGLYSIVNNTEFNFNELLIEVCKYGKELFRICQKNFKVLGIDTNILQVSVLTDALKTSNIEKILEIFKSWCKNYGFPIKPKEYKFCDEQITYYELDFEQISTLYVQFIIIYLLSTFYDDFLFFIRCEKKELCDLEESNITTLKRINKIGKLLSISLPTLSDEDIYHKVSSMKSKLKGNVLKSVIPILNNYSHYFNHSSHKFFSYSKGRIFYQQVYENIFDICWDLISRNYTDFRFSTRYCKNCSAEIPAKTDQKYCEKCSKDIRSSNQTQSSKIPLIKEIIEYYNNNYEFITDSDSTLQSQVEKYASYIYEKGHTKALEQTRKKDLNSLLDQLKKATSPF